MVGEGILAGLGGLVELTGAHHSALGGRRSPVVCQGRGCRSEEDRWLLRSPGHCWSRLC